MSTSRSIHPATATLLAALGLLTAACADPGQATLRITAYGEEYVERGIPADALSDGWSVEFHRFLVAIAEVEASGEPLSGAFVVDLTRPSDGEGHLLGALTLPAEGVPELSYRVAPPIEAPTPVSATADDVAALVDARASLLVEGTATRGAEEIGFSWIWATDTRYEQCASTAELAQDPEPTSQLTFHADHLFYDDLDSPTPNVSFDLVAAADADANGEVTEAELRALDITTQARYQVGSRDVTDLWAFIEVQTGTLGHIDGEGHCERGS